MADWNYTNLNMKGVVPQRENNGLPEGRHICDVRNAELKQAKGGSMQVAFDLIEINGAGKTFDRITVYHPRAQQDAKAAKSVEIGKERLKALLVYGGHPNPDNHRDIRELNSLRVGVICERDEDWVDDNGATRKGGVKPKKSGAYFAPDGSSAPATSGETSHDDKWAQPREGGPSDMDDEIPF